MPQLISATKCLSLENLYLTSAREHMYPLDGSLCQAGKYYYYKQRERGKEVRTGLTVFQVLGQQLWGFFVFVFLICPGSQCRAEALKGQRARLYTPQETIQMCRENWQGAFWRGRAKRPHPLSVVSAPADLPPAQRWGLGRGRGGAEKNSVRTGRRKLIVPSLI